MALYRDPGPNDIVGDLLALTGTAVDRARLRPIAPRNVSMHRRKTLFLAGMPKPAGATADPRDRVAPRFLARVVADSDAIADDGGASSCRPRERHALVAAHLDGNRALVDRLGLADPGPFLELPDPDAPWTPPAPIARARSPRSAAPPSPPACVAATRSPPPGWRRRSPGCWRR